MNAENTNILKINNANIDASFAEIAEELFKYYLIKVNEKHYQLIDIEFYYYTPNDLHKDIYAHKHKLQKINGTWYFHASGIDITFGNITDESYGGILLRAILPVSNQKITNEYLMKNVINGPRLVKTELCSNFYGVFGNIPNIFQLIHRNKTNKDIQLISPEEIIKTKRHGLNPNKIGNDVQKYHDSKYRYVVFPICKHIDKTIIAHDMKEQFPLLTESELINKLGSNFFKKK